MSTSEKARQPQGCAGIVGEDPKNAEQLCATLRQETQVTVCARVEAEAVEDGATLQTEETEMVTRTQAYINRFSESVNELNLRPERCRGELQESGMECASVCEESNDARISAIAAE